ncbi:MAG: KGG domain-containing protein [Chloroflexota bacterium]
MASNRGGQGGSSERGFAGMDDKKQREIASQGGKASARQQNRGPNGQFTGRSGGSSNSGSSSRSSSSSGSRSRGSNR